MNITEQEKRIESLCRKDLYEDNKNQLIKVWFCAERDIRVPNARAYLYFYDESLSNIIDSNREAFMEYYDALKELLIYKAQHGELYSDIVITLHPNGNYEFRYWFNEERIIKEEYESAMLRSTDFPHAMAKALVFYDLAEVNFKKKYESIIMTFEIKEGEPFVDYYLVNEKGQHKPVYDSNKVAKYGDIISKNISMVKAWLKEHYERTNHGILKDVWKPWNKIVVSVPPSGYLNELEDIHYYLDELELEKDFFLERY
ncbi:hypothetical protein [Flectobacillus sp. BAB-3569]|uniref:hypothetical protein n=1 Tax=Flectobacillus sp. BAB-3569 TaxID=1509483 RepID=UPI000BA2E26B|nr:hypothetical protein [Flectobacillus sp. BAB-3569]PAC31120.1 hypothetical protein BWI92_10385 [Flectobacillus sp. BAB-3569]